MIAQRLKGSLYILAGVTTWFFVRSMSEWIVARRYFPIPNFVFEMGDLFYHLLGLIASFTVLAFMYMNYKSKSFLEEVSVETSKVTWPTFEDATNSSIVVVFTVAILMGFLAFSDFALARIFDLLLWGNLRG